MGQPKLRSDKRMRRMPYRTEVDRKFMRNGEEVTVVDKVWKVDPTVAMDQSYGIGPQGSTKEQALAFYSAKYDRNFEIAEIAKLASVSRRVRRAIIKQGVKNA